MTDESIDSIPTPKRREKIDVAKDVSVIVGLTLSTISLIGICATELKDAFTPKRAELVGTVAYLNGSGARFVVSNRGIRPATITSAHAEGPATMSGCKIRPEYKQRLDIGSTFMVVEPGKTYAVTTPDDASLLLGDFNPEVLEDKKYDKMIDKFKECQLVVHYIDFDSSHQKLAIPYACVPQGDCIKPPPGEQ